MCYITKHIRIEPPFDLWLKLQHHLANENIFNKSISVFDKNRRTKTVLFSHSYHTNQCERTHFNQLYVLCLWLHKSEKRMPETVPKNFSYMQNNDHTMLCSYLLEKCLTSTANMNATNTYGQQQQQRKKLAEFLTRAHFF